LNIASNRQHLPTKLIQNLERKFDPKLRPDLTKVCIKVAENNQQFSKNFLEKLENYVEDKTNQNNSLLFALFCQLEQKMEFFSKEAAINVFKSFISSDSVETMVEMSNMFDKLIKNYGLCAEKSVNKCIVKGLEHKNELINMNCIKVLQSKKVDFSSIIKTSLANLLKKDCSDILRKHLFNFLNDADLKELKTSILDSLDTDKVKRNEQQDMQG
jgi:hypothetical protein